MKAIVNLPLHPVEYFPINFLIHANYFNDDIYLFDLNWQLNKIIELGGKKIYPPPKNRNLSLRKNESFLHNKNAACELKKYLSDEDSFLTLLQGATECLVDYEEIFLVRNEDQLSQIFLEKLAILYPEMQFKILNDFPVTPLKKLSFFNLDLNKYWYHNRVCQITSKNKSYIDVITSTKKFDAIEFVNLNDVTNVDNTILTGSYLTLKSDIDKRLDYATLQLTSNDIETKLNFIEDFFLLCRRNRIKLTLHFTIDKNLLGGEKDFFKLCKKFNIREISQFDAKGCFEKSLKVNNVSFSKDLFYDFLKKLKKQKLLTHDVKVIYELYTKTKG